MLKRLLLIPALEHVEALLGPGIGGGNPPIGYRFPYWDHSTDCLAPCGEETAPLCPGCHDRRQRGVPLNEVGPCISLTSGGSSRMKVREVGLILVWDGQVAIEGANRLASFLNRRDISTSGYWVSVGAGDVQTVAVGFLADVAVQRDFGTLAIGEK